MNSAGYLRLMPTEMLAQNMSNRVPDEYRKNIEKLTGKTSPRKRARWLDMPFIKHRLLAIYDHIFRWYYE
jgi:hypothetical protein